MRFAKFTFKVLHRYFPFRFLKHVRARERYIIAASLSRSHSSRCALRIFGRATLGGVFLADATGAGVVCGRDALLLILRYVILCAFTPPPRGVNRNGSLAPLVYVRVPSYWHLPVYRFRRRNSYAFLLSSSFPRIFFNCVCYERNRKRNFKQK